MPSLFTHLLLAQDALESQPAGEGRSFLETHSYAYYLGALCPDLPYFDIFHHYRGMPLGVMLAPVTNAMEARVLAWLGWSSPERDGWGWRLHGVAAPSVLEAWAGRALRGFPAWGALAAGMLTHCACDEVLHPKVNADSGDPSTAEAMRRHREIEIALDYVLLRSRGVAVESLSLTGFLEAYLGSVGQNGEYL
ncbi:MAG: zinc dependent phospholipase C family protein, partial [bacterium]